MDKKLLLVGAVAAGGYMAWQAMKSYAQQYRDDPAKVKVVEETPEGKFRVTIRGLPDWLPAITLDSPGMSAPELGSAIRSPFTIPPRSFLRRPRRIERILSEVQYGEPKYMHEFREMAR